jgi:hypothetical protein
VHLGVRDPGLLEWIKPSPFGKPETYFRDLKAEGLKNDSAMVPHHDCELHTFTPPTCHALLLIRFTDPTCTDRIGSAILKGVVPRLSFPSF